MESDGKLVTIEQTVQDIMACAGIKDCGTCGKYKYCKHAGSQGRSIRELVERHSREWKDPGQYKFKNLMYRMGLQFFQADWIARVGGNASITLPIWLIFEIKHKKSMLPKEDWGYESLPVSEKQIEKHRKMQKDYPHKIKSIIIFYNTREEGMIYGQYLDVLDRGSHFYFKETRRGEIIPKIAYDLRSFLKGEDKVMAMIRENMTEGCGDMT